MAQARVRFVVEQGAMNQKEYVFQERVHCVIGRNDECLPMQVKDDNVSRHHCELDINPPEVIIRELGSLNGTTINGELIGQREANETPAQGRARQYGDFPLTSGDSIVLAGSVHLRVQIEGDREDAYATQRAQKPMSLEQRQRMAQAKNAEEVKARDEFGRQVQERVRQFLDPNAYEIGDPIGKGGMGYVVKGMRKKDGAPVAIKLILPHLMQDDEMQKRFMREIGIMERLQHPYVVPFQGLFTGEEFFCIVLGFCDGGNLGDWIIRRNEWPSPKRATGLMIEMLSGLEYAHSLGIIHRDLKPANVLMQFDTAKRQFQPRLADFGLARALDEASMTATGTTGGTPQFMPRQQAMKFKYSEPEVDVWASAAILYWMLTEGETPRDFPQGTPPIRVVLQQSAKKIRERNPHVPKQLADVIDEALVDNPKIQIRTARELRERLERVMVQL